MRFVFACLLSLSVTSVFMGCRSTYQVETATEKVATYSFVRPAEYVIFELGSASQWLELVSESQIKNDKGNLCVSIALRNRGTQGFWGWFLSCDSHDMTIYAVVDFFDSKNRHIISIPAQAVVLPLGETKYFNWTAPMANAAYAKVTFKD